MKALAGGALVFFLAGCGGAEIVASSPLLVLATYPGDGALIEAGETRLAFSFNESIDPASLAGAVLGEQLTLAGVPVQELSISSVVYTEENKTAVYEVPRLASGSIYQIKLSAAQVRATSGAQLVADLTLRFQSR